MSSGLATLTGPVLDRGAGARLQASMSTGFYKVEGSNQAR